MHGSSARWDDAGASPLELALVTGLVGAILALAIAVIGPRVATMFSGDLTCQWGRTCPTAQVTHTPGA